MSEDTKKFTSFDKGINLVSKPSDLDEYDNEPDVLRAVLSCGHVTDPETLTDCCRAQMDDGKTEFKCPLCEKKWPYDEVRKLAKLSDDEKLIFEDKVGTNTVKKLVDFRGCLREWKGPGPRADRCANVGCTIDQKLLKECPMITLKSVQNVQCPAIRACTSCGILLEHNNKGHKIIECHACNNRFCFICLKPADECIKSATHYIVCTAGVAPRQVD